MTPSISNTKGALTDKFAVLGRYRNSSENEFLLKLYDFLNQEEMMVRMEAASDVGKPAVEALSRYLLKAFGPAEHFCKEHKQYIGWEARRIMEGRGYVLDQQGVKICSENNLFNRATRYKLPSR